MDKFLFKKIQELPETDKLDILLTLSNEVEETLDDSLGTFVPPVVPMLDYAELAIEYAKNPKLLDGKSTGIKSLDTVTRGLSKGELTVISGPTGHGKTNVAQNISLHWAKQGLPVLFFSLEMPPLEITTRFMSTYKSFGKAEEAGTFPIYLWKGGVELTIKNLRNTIKVMQEQNGIELVVIDHLHYFDHSTDKLREDLDSIVRSIKRIAVELEIPIILIAHTRKLQSDTSEPQEVDLKDSSGIAQDADMVVMVWRNKTSEDREERRRIYFHVTKNRMKSVTGKQEAYLDENWAIKDLTTRIFEEER